MNPTTTLTQAPVELASRSGDGIDVALLWAPASDRLTVAVVDTRLNTTFRLSVDGENAMHVFDHPYVYAATRGLLDDGPAGAPAYREPAAALD